MRRALLLLACCLLPVLLPAADPSVAAHYIARQALKYDIVIPHSGSGQIPGTVDYPDPSTVRIIGLDGQTQTFPVDAVDVVSRHTPAEIVRIRGRQALANQDYDDIVATLKWARGLNDPAADKEALALVDKVQPATVDNVDLAQQSIAIYSQAKVADKEEAVARAVLARDPQWSDGWQLVADLLKADPARVAEYQDWLLKWRAAEPTAFMPNQVLGPVFEERHDWRQARDCYFNAYMLDHDPASGIGLARIDIIKGDLDRALEVLQPLLTSPVAADAQAMAGAATLFKGDLSHASDLFQAALKGTPSDAGAQLARYDLGLIALRTGHADDARQLWQQVKTPVAALALACLDGQPFTALDTLPSDDLKRIATELNACVGLEQNQYAAAGSLDANARPRYAFLNVLAKVELTSGSPDSVRDLQQLDGTDPIETLRWVAYGQLLGHRLDEAEATLRRLPADDSYAQVYRLCLADAHKDAATARTLLKSLANDPRAPTTWLARAADIYAQHDNDVVVTNFHWPAGDVPQEGWQYSSPGTGIHIHCEDNRLVFDGTQTASEDPVNRAYLPVPESKLMEVQLDLDLTDIGAATAGLELLTANRAAGIAVGVLSDNRIGWRQMVKSAYGPWNPLPLQFQGTHARLDVIYGAGQVTVVSPNDILQKFPLHVDHSPFIPGTDLTVAIFGFAPPGTTWKIAATGITLQLRPSSDASGATTPAPAPGLAP